ncbi:hypothetical protein AVO45_03910 [Ruegeria marisrubri]|uniref:Uncharacterized protein n=2 Tax=Ruegeria marisrubri TaxID=1685379 RepID=A0A101CZ92_9RHOB|nr:hypothetical protein AVO45_03910 [Ruegeria marisrubri]
MNILKINLSLLAFSSFVSGCSISPESMETDPVLVETSQGIVTCQLYTQSRVLWDRAIDRPESMSVQEADEVCRNEGYRRMNG